MTGVPVEHWTRTPENVADCRAQMERRFQSWDRGVLTFFYFAFLAFATLKIASCLWNCGARVIDRPERNRYAIVPREDFERMMMLNGPAIVPYRRRRKRTRQRFATTSETENEIDDESDEDASDSNKRDKVYT
jgi:hypothetical protein